MEELEHLIPAGGPAVLSMELLHYISNVFEAQLAKECEAGTFGGPSQVEPIAVPPHSMLFVDLQLTLNHATCDVQRSMAVHVLAQLSRYEYNRPAVQASLDVVGESLEQMIEAHAPHVQGVRDGQADSILRDVVIIFARIMNYEIEGVHLLDIVNGDIRLALGAITAIFRYYAKSQRQIGQILNMPSWLDDIELITAMTRCLYDFSLPRAFFVRLQEAQQEAIAIESAKLEGGHPLHGKAIPESTNTTAISKLQGQFQKFVVIMLRSFMYLPLLDLITFILDDWNTYIHSHHSVQGYQLLPHFETALGNVMGFLANIMNITTECSLQLRKFVAVESVFVQQVVLSYLLHLVNSFDYKTYSPDNLKQSVRTLLLVLKLLGFLTFKVKIFRPFLRKYSELPSRMLYSEVLWESNLRVEVVALVVRLLINAEMDGDALVAVLQRAGGMSVEDRERLSRRLTHPKEDMYPVNVHCMSYKSLQPLFVGPTEDDKLAAATQQTQNVGSGTTTAEPAAPKFDFSNFGTTSASSDSNPFAAIVANSTIGVNPSSRVQAPAMRKMNFTGNRRQARNRGKLPRHSYLRGGGGGGGRGRRRRTMQDRYNEIKEKKRIASPKIKSVDEAGNDMPEEDDEDTWSSTSSDAAAGSGSTPQQHGGAQDNKGSDLSPDAEWNKAPRRVTPPQTPPIIVNSPQRTVVQNPHAETNAERATRRAMEALEEASMQAAEVDIKTKVAEREARAAAEGASSGGGGASGGGGGLMSHLQEEENRDTLRGQQFFAQALPTQLPKLGHLPPVGSESLRHQVGPVAHGSMGGVKEDHDEDEDDSSASSGADDDGSAGPGEKLKKWRTKAVTDGSIPSHYLCALSQELISIPVISPYGDCFEKATITSYLREVGNHTCPMTGQPLYATDLVVDSSLKREIDKWRLSNYYAASSGGTKRF